MDDLFSIIEFKQEEIIEFNHNTENSEQKLPEVDDQSINE
jgi:hypothetical protein